MAKDVEYERRGPALQWSLSIFIILALSFFALVALVNTYLKNGSLQDYTIVIIVYLALVGLTIVWTRIYRNTEEKKISLGDRSITVGDETIEFSSIAGADMNAFGTTRSGAIVRLVSGDPDYGTFIYLWTGGKTLTLVPKNPKDLITDLAQRMEAAGITIEKKTAKARDGKTWVYRIDVPGKERMQKSSASDNWQETAIAAAIYMIGAAAAYCTDPRKQSKWGRMDIFLWFLNPALVACISFFVLTTVQPAKRPAAGLKMGIAFTAGAAVVAYALAQTIRPDAAALYTTPAGIIVFAETLILPTIIGWLAKRL